MSNGWGGTRAATLAVAVLWVTCETAVAAVWGCHGTKPGHPTPAEREQFIAEVSDLAVKAERKHGVPASALVAIAIAESGYGWTRLAIEANNLFAWKAGAAATAAGKAFVPPCERARGARTGFVIFPSRAEAFDFVAGRLAKMGPYREHTAAYVASRARGVAAETAVDAWVSRIAMRYSGSPEGFTRKIKRIMNNPAEPSQHPSPETNLYRLSVEVATTR
jgi:hypothetical protein